MIKRWLCCISLLIVVLSVYVLTDRVQAASTMTSSDKLVTYVKTMEGFRAKPYWDHTQYSIGYGTKCPSDKYDYYCQHGITDSEAVALLKKELSTVESALNSFAAKHKLNWKQHQFDALVSFTFNVGPQWLSETSGNMYGAVVSGDTGNRFIYSIGLWSTASGQFVLLERRMSEANLYINGAYEPYNTSSKPFPDSYRWVFLDGNGGTVRYRVWCYDATTPVTPDVLFTAYPAAPNNKLIGWCTADGRFVTEFDASLTRGETMYAVWSDSANDTVTPTPVKVYSMKLSVTGDVVNLRKGAGTSYATSGCVKKGAAITITEVQAGGDYLWGKTANGWIALKYTTFSQTSGWLKENGQIVYYEKGVKVKSVWRYDGDQKCYLSKEGYRVINGWVHNGTGWVWLDENGYAVSSAWVDNSGKTYYCNANGYRVTGDQTIDGKLYRFNEHGVLQTELYTVQFLDWDGTQLTSAVYAPGATVTVPNAPAREADETYTYTFTGWTPEITAVTGNASYTAVYTSQEIIPPAILKQPEAVTAPSGSTVSFTVEAQGYIVSYRWEYRIIYKWFSTTMEGFDTATLTVPVTGTRHGYDYHCVITYEDGTQLTTEPAKLTVETAPQILSHPNNQSVALGYKGQFTVAAQGEGITYQWQYQRPDGTKWIDTAMEGCNKPTVMIETTNARNGYKYRCKVTDVTGKVIYTEPATLSILSVKQQPQNAAAFRDSTAYFTVDTSTVESVTYQWQYSRNGSTWSNTTMEGYNTNTLKVDVTAGRNGYQYRCILTGSKNCKLTTQAATLTVLTITGQPADHTAAPDTVAQFSVSTNSAEGVTYQWQYSRNGSKWSNTTMEGCNTAMLHVAATTGRNGYQYRCLVTDAAGNTVISEIATLTVN